MKQQQVVEKGVVGGGSKGEIFKAIEKLKNINKSDCEKDIPPFQVKKQTNKQTTPKKNLLLAYRPRK